MIRKGLLRPSDGIKIQSLTKDWDRSQISPEQPTLCHLNNVADSHRLLRYPYHNKSNLLTKTRSMALKHLKAASSNTANNKSLDHPAKNQSKSLPQPTCTSPLREYLSRIISKTNGHARTHSLHSRHNTSSRSHL